MCTLFRHIGPKSRKSNVVKEIEKLKKNREERRCASSSMCHILALMHSSVIDLIYCLLLQSQASRASQNKKCGECR